MVLLSHNAIFVIMQSFTEMISPVRAVNACLPSILVADANCLQHGSSQNAGWSKK